LRFSPPRWETQVREGSAKRRAQTILIGPIAGSSASEALAPRHVDCCCFHGWRWTAMLTWTTPEQGSIDMAFYELRQYKVLPGKMNEWVKIMEEEIIPFQISKGMVITGSYRGETDDSCYVWMRRFENEAEREALYKAVYDSDHWKTQIAPKVPQCLDRSAMVVTRIVPTAKSTAQ
jgi:hypothetical protein